VRAAISALGLSLGLVSAAMAAAMAMPTASPAVLSNTIRIHGCHHYYAHDLSGWHRHDKACGTLKGLVGKGRATTKS
jgi:hypothetical protein